MAFIRQFKTASGATGVQVCHKEHGRVVATKHVGSANSALALKKLLKKAQSIIDEDKNALFNLKKFDQEQQKIKLAVEKSAKKWKIFAGAKIKLSLGF